MPNTVETRTKFMTGINVKRLVRGWDKYVEQALEGYFQSQVNADGRAFPKKKSGRGKFLYDTGQMTGSLRARLTQAGVRAGISNKQEIYSRYLHPKTEWLALSKADVSQLLEIVARNWRKTQGVK